jgi:hypothetical protein
VTKAKYYVDTKWLHWAWWPKRGIHDTRKQAEAYASSLARGMYKENGVRVRHKGRTIDRWQDGRKVKR